MSINTLQSRLGVISTQGTGPSSPPSRSPLLPTPNYRLVLPAPAPFYHNVFRVSSPLLLWTILILWAAQAHSCQVISPFCSLACSATGRAGLACLPTVAVRHWRSSQRDRSHRGTAPFLSLTPKHRVLTVRTHGRVRKRHRTEATSTGWKHLSPCSAQCCRAPHSIIPIRVRPRFVSA